METYLSGLNGRVLVAAHRGLAAGNVPCNSIPGYKAALGTGADVIELDVSKSLDGTLYCFHPGMEKRFTGSDRYISGMRDEEVDKLRLLNMDGAMTAEKVPLLRDALTLMKDRCRVNVDKFWDDIPGISALIRELGMNDQVIIKAQPKEENLRLVRQYAPDMPFMPVLFGDGGIHEMLLKDRDIRYVGAEVIFDSEDSEFCQARFIEKVHKDGCALWVNPIIYDYHWQLTAGHSDDVAVSEDEYRGWGWLIDKGYDILQTDFPLQLKMYINRSYPDRA
ncbi:MAG: glycerophosphodiester phosphodiesterase family protein [Clostridiales bacterium]|nr:glycerophosphodiester phosphodiesterase family protein [Clostridiales bacterium]